MVLVLGLWCESIKLVKNGNNGNWKECFNDETENSDTQTKELVFYRGNRIASTQWSREWKKDQEFKEFGIW